MGGLMWIEVAISLLQLNFNNTAMDYGIAGEHAAEEEVGQPLRNLNSPSGEQHKGLLF